ncbi:MAG: alpha/beta fold hydrolase [Candidatus Andersenbacteria bacterium]
MVKRAYIIHGWDGYPEEGWFPWAKAELEKQGFVVEVPNMPHPDRPTIDDWVGHLTKLVGQPDEVTYLIGHSMGCQTILRYLASLNGRKVGGAILIAGFFELVPLESDEEKEIVKPWLKTPIDFEKVKAATNNITVILSDNDEWVPLERNKQLFEQYLSPTIITEHAKGHYSGSSGVKELPAVLEAVLK